MSPKDPPLHWPLEQHLTRPTAYLPNRCSETAASREQARADAHHNTTMMSYPDTLNRAHNRVHDGPRMKARCASPYNTSHTPWNCVFAALGITSCQTKYIPYGLRHTVPPTASGSYQTPRTPVAPHATHALGLAGVPMKVPHAPAHHDFLTIPV